MNENYDTYLSSDSWRNKREQLFLLKGRHCERCGSENMINVHHASYKKKYNEPLDHLFILCKNCHEEFHKKYKMGKSMLNKTLNFIRGKGWSKKSKFSKKEK